MNTENPASTRKVNKPTFGRVIFYAVAAIAGFYLLVVVLLYLIFWAGRPGDVSLLALFGGAALVTPVVALLCYIGAFSRR